MVDYIPLLVFLLLIAAVLREDAVFSILYLMAGVYIGARWWSQKALSSVKYQRVFTTRAFLYETITVRLRLTNTGWLPVLWLQLHESLPAELGTPKTFRQALSMRAHDQAEYSYQVHTKKRGYYSIGPLFIRSGDFLGMSDEHEVSGTPDFLIVYPRIISLAAFSLPSRTPFGTIKHFNPIYEDPARIHGKRAYTHGDSLRRIDWKSSAATGQLQVKQYGASIALETAIFLNLNAAEYDPHARFSDTELAIVTAASIANWVVSRRQAVGLLTNATDPLDASRRSRPVMPEKGRSHLMAVLDLLARAQSEDTSPLVALIHEQAPRLAWGTTLVVITPLLDDPLFDALFQAQRYGLSPMLLQVGSHPSYLQSSAKARMFGFSVCQVVKERDLETWSCQGHG